MTTTVNFILIEKKDVLILPNDAIVKKEGGQYVTVRNEDGTLAETKIFAGFTDGSQVEILKGLDAGTTVVYE
ncbi:efflux RND transporter periplasmic adaptor subunit, partial [Aduncisulcus paluster]